jgi:hypothetical protein
MALHYKISIITAIVSALAVCSVSAIYASPRHELRALYRLCRKQYISSEVTRPEFQERVKFYRLLFHSGDIGKVRRILDATLTKRRGWHVHVDTPGHRIEYDRRHEYVEYLSEAQYNYIERGINNSAWYTEGKLAPRAFRGGCVVQYF